MRICIYMDNEFIDEIIRKYELRKKDCDKLLEVCEVIEASRKNSENPFLSCDVLISSLQAKGLSYKHIRDLEDIWFDMTGSHPFTISNSGYFEPKNNSWIYGDDLKEKSTKYVVLKLISFVYQDFRENLESLKKHIPNNDGIITIYTEGATLRRDFEGTMLFCNFKEGDPLTVINELTVYYKKRALRGSFFGKEKGKNWPRTVIGINKRVCDKLKLNPKEPFIINDGGYKINEQKYQII